MAWGRPLKLHWAQQRGGPVVAPSSPEAQLFDVFVGDLARDVDEQVLFATVFHFALLHERLMLPVCPFQPTSHGPSLRLHIGVSISKTMVVITEL